MAITTNTQLVPTTFQMDGLLTEKDIEDRFFVMTRCKDCRLWTKQDLREPERVCEHCESKQYEYKDTRSLRTWNSLLK